MPIESPSDLVEFVLVQRPTAQTTGTRTSTARIDVSRYEYILLVMSCGSMGDAQITPTMYAEPTGGTGVACDGTNGQPDHRITFLNTEDNLAACLQIRCSTLPGRYMEFASLIATATSTFSLCVIGFMRGVTAQTSFTPKVAHIGFA